MLEELRRCRLPKPNCSPITLGIVAAVRVFYGGPIRSHIGCPPGPEPQFAGNVFTTLQLQLILQMSLLTDEATADVKTYVEEEHGLAQEAWENRTAFCAQFAPPPPAQPKPGEPAIPPPQQPPPPTTPPHLQQPTSAEGLMLLLGIGVFALVARQAAKRL